MRRLLAILLFLASCAHDPCWPSTRIGIQVAREDDPAYCHYDEIWVERFNRAERTQLDECVNHVYMGPGGVLSITACCAMKVGGPRYCSDGQWVWRE